VAYAGLRWPAPPCADLPWASCIRDPPPEPRSVSLDVVVRQDLLRVLQSWSRPGATIIYLTHLRRSRRLSAGQPHLHYLSDKRAPQAGRVSSGELDLPAARCVPGQPSPLLRIAEHWLRAELEVKRARKGNRGGSLAAIAGDPIISSRRRLEAAFYYWSLYGIASSVKLCQLSPFPFQIPTPSDGIS
jgi:hypothetical protein